MPAPGVGLRVTRPDEHPKQDACNVRVEDGCAAAEREARQCSGRVSADALERSKRCLVRGQAPTVARNSFSGDRVQSLRPDVVPERIPRACNVGLRRVSKRRQARVLAEPLMVFGQHAIDLRLLEHHLRNENVVRVVGLAPRKCSPVVIVPSQQQTPEALTLLGTGKRETASPRSQM
jgi:hypothetical protein